MLQRLLLGIVLFILGSCAQIGTLSGGEKDTTAPQLIGSFPVMGATQVYPELIQLQFDEFIELNNPMQNFRLEPADATLKTALKNRTVLVALKGELSPNTTYSLYIDGGVKDVSEGNDSVYQYVFSTGKTLDSSRQTYRLGDAYTKNSLEGVTIGLYASDTSLKPRYLTKSNQAGWASLDYLPLDSFFVKAFVDANKNGLIDANEQQYSRFNPLVPSNDSLAFLLSTPRDVARLHSFKIAPPGLLVGHLPQEIALSDVQVNGQQPAMFRVGRDSVVINIKAFEPGSLVVSCPLDTVYVPFSAKEKSAILKLQILPAQIQAPIDLTFNAFLPVDFDKNWLSIMRQDSTIVSIDRISVENNTLHIYPSEWGSGKFKLILNASALQGALGFSLNSKGIEFTGVGQNEIGTLTVNLNAPKNNQIIVLEKDGKSLRSFSLNESLSQVRFDHLVPGEYQLAIIADDNGNGYWDPIQPALKSQAEAVTRYTKIPKVRANWDVEVTLE
jgi:hypothetical protein